MNPFRIFFFLIGYSILALISSCSKSKEIDEEPPRQTTLQILAPLPEFAAKGGEEKFFISSNCSWSVEVEMKEEDEGGWFEVVPLSGKAAERLAITVIVDPHEAYVGRSFNLVLRADGGGAGQRIEVIQNKKNVILLGENTLNVGAGESTLSVEVQSNVDYVVSFKEGDKWIDEVPETRTQFGLETKTHVFRVARIPEMETRTGIVVFTDTNSKLSDELQIVQAAQKPVVEEPLPEREALQRFYEAAGGSGWTHNDNWCSDKPLEEWFGIETDSDGCVVALRLPNNNLTGTISDKVADLSRLRDIDLSWNSLGGELGSPYEGSDNFRFSRLTHLTTLNLSHNDLDGGLVVDWLNSIKYVQSTSLRIA